jgi:hypothetical protein
MKTGVALQGRGKRGDGNASKSKKIDDTCIL